MGRTPEVDSVTAQEKTQKTARNRECFQNVADDGAFLSVSNRVGTLQEMQEINGEHCGDKCTDLLGERYR